jgi:hypothetical protein
VFEIIRTWWDAIVAAAAWLMAHIAALPDAALVTVAVACIVLVVYLVSTWHRAEHRHRAQARRRG